MPAPGPLNTICDVPGISVGNAEDHALTTGATVVLPDAPVLAAVDHRGGGIGSRDTVTLQAGSVIEHIHAIALSGGSAYGLDAAGGVMHGLRARGVGFRIGAEVVPLVPQAIIFDLLCGGPKSWDRPPWWALGAAALANAGPTFALGNAGAGLGATAGPLKGGLGSASIVTDCYTVGAIAVANPFGGTVMPGSGTFWGWFLEEAGELGCQRPPTAKPLPPEPRQASPIANTTLAVVATDAALTRDQAQRVAIMAQDGFAHAIRPAHGPLDGDTVFVISTGTRPAPDPTIGLTELGRLAGDTTARAIMRGVYAAEPLAGFPSYRELHGRVGRVG